MNGLGEGIGTAIEGGLLSRAVEPSHGSAAGEHHAPTECRNCGAMVAGQYCGQCGQNAHVHRSLAAIGHDIMHGVLHLDGKLWDTLPLLTLKPGQLTRRYIEGERAKFVSPMAMFLFTIFAMFAVFQMVGFSAPVNFGAGFIDGARSESGAVFRTNIEEQITTLEKERDSLPKGDPRRETINGELKIIRKMIAPETGVEGSETSITGIGFLDEGIIAKWKANPSLMFYKLQANSYKFSWLLIPLSLPFVWLLFAWRRQFKAYDHAVFVTYSLAFMSLLFIVMSILSTIPGGGNWAFWLFVMAAPLHLYKQLRHAYGLTHFSALWRFVMLLVFINIVIVLFLQALLVLGAF
jgi:hypothetical protein